jgi:hypothetical protein
MLACRLDYHVLLSVNVINKNGTLCLNMQKKENSDFNC